jgi:hypothetical protein
MKYLGNNGFGSTAPWAKNMPSYNDYYKNFDYWLNQGLPNGAAVGLPELQARWEQNHPVVDDNFAPGTGGPITHDLMGNGVVSSQGQTFDLGGPNGRIDRSLAPANQSRHMGVKQNKAVGGLIHEPDADDKLSGYGTDTVPAALTPGEVVFNKKQLQGIQPRPGHKHKLRSDQLVAIAAAMAHKGKKKAPR